MAPVVGAVMAAAIGEFLTSVAIAFVGNIVLGAVSRALTKKPKSSFESRGRTVTVKQPIYAHEIVYGETRKGGFVPFMHSTEDNSKLHMVIVLAAHQVEAIGNIYFNDELVPLDSNGNAIGKYAERVIVKKHLGEPNQAADALLMAEAPDKWTANHRLRGRAYIYVQMIRDQDVFPTGLPNVSADVKGKRLYDPRSAATLYSNNALLCIRDYMTAANGVAATTSEVDDSVAQAEANTADEIVATAAQATTFTADPDSDDLTLAGTVLNALVTGERVQPSTTDTLPGGLSATSYYWIRTATGKGKLATSLANARAGTAVNITSAGSGSHTLTRTGQPRYTCNGVVDTALVRRQIIQALLTSCAGQAVWTAGTWRLLVGAYRAPAVTITDGMIVAPPSVRGRVGARESFNRIKGIYVSPVNHYQESDIPPVTNATYLAEDLGEPRWKDAVLPFTDTPLMGQRLLKIELEKARQQISVSLRCNMKAFGIAGGDVFAMTRARYGWTAKPFECRSWTFAIEPDDTGVPALYVDLAGRETASGVYDWNDGEETSVDLAPDTDLPNPFTVGAPSGLTLESGNAHLLDLSEGSITSRIFASWTQPGGSFLVQQQVQWKKSSESVWTSQFISGDVESTYIAPVKDGVMYDVRVRGINALGVRGGWATVTGHTVLGKTEPPNKPDTFTVERLADGTRRFNWTQAFIPADVRSGGGWEIRWYLGTTSDWTAMEPLVITGLLRASPYETNELAAGTYTFAIKTVDSSGNPSTDALFVNATIGDPRLQNVLVQQLEHALGWPGTLTDCWRYGSTLRALHTTAGEIDDLDTTIAGLPATIDALSPRRSPIAYETEVIDLGIDVSFTPLVSVLADGAVTITMKTGISADGTVTGAYGPLGTVSAKRYFQVRIEVAGATPHVQQMTTLLDGATQVDEFNDVNTATETAVWFESVAAGHFKIGSRSGRMASVTTAAIDAIQNVGAGWDWVLISKSQVVNGEPAAEFKLYNASGVLANATVDVTLKGPKE